MPSQEAEQWVASLADAESWKTDQFLDFVRYIRESQDSTDLWIVFQAIDEENLSNLQKVNADAWEELALFYCEWVARSGFNFDFCDVLVRRLECIFETGSIGAKAAAALAAAELGVSHNRWFVMRRLMAMCGKSLETSVARRIAIEIAVEEAESNFCQAAIRIDRTLADYHPVIAEYLGAHDERSEVQ